MPRAGVSRRLGPAHMHQDRRELQRHFSDLLQVALRRRGLFARLGAGLPCQVIDFSRAGMGLISRASFGPGTEVLIDLTLAEVGSVRLSGLVQHANPFDYAHYRLGVEFDPFDGESELNTAQTLATLMAIDAALMRLNSAAAGQSF